MGISTHYINPLMDWANHFNYGLIFFLGFAITAAEEHGLGNVMHHGRWIYLVAGFTFSCLRAVHGEILPYQGAPDWIYTVVDGLLM